MVLMVYKEHLDPVVLLDLLGHLELLEILELQYVFDGYILCTYKIYYIL